MTITPIFTGQEGARGIYRVRDEERTRTVAIAGSAADRWIWVDGQVHHIVTALQSRARGRAGSGRDDYSAPMPATVVRVNVSVGVAVRHGDTLLVLEAMKMELPVRAERDGIVTALLCAQGDLVQPGRPLLTVGDPTA